MFIISMFTVSTSDIADTADSPTLATIIESIRPTAIGKIAGEQLIKLQTLGLTSEEAEAKIIEGFLRG